MHVSVVCHGAYPQQGSLVLVLAFKPSVRHASFVSCLLTILSVAHLGVGRVTRS